ncbi:Maf family protein [Opitutales bacterium]|nr:Maf family protein [Opitutales bacterium]
MSADLKKATQKPKYSFVLASGSPRRKELLASLLENFKVETASVSELKVHPDGPIALAMENARLKADAVSQRYPDKWVLGADTLVVLGDDSLGKPIDLADAKSMLIRLSGKTHSVYTGVCLVNRSQEIKNCKVVSSLVSFKVLDDSTIEEYFQVVNPLDKAGAYALQTRADLIVCSFEGSRSNVIGLPMELLRTWFDQLEIVTLNKS